MGIQAAKNLMNTVVLTVKSSYVASTKYQRQAAASGLDAKSIVVWKMRAPERNLWSGEMHPKKLRLKYDEAHKRRNQIPWKLWQNFRIRMDRFSWHFPYLLIVPSFLNNFKKKNQSGLLSNICI